MLNTVRCQGLRVRKVLKVVWLHAAIMAISVALGPSRITSDGEVRREGERHRQRLGVQRRRHRHRHLEDRGEDGEHQQRRERRRVGEVQPGERGRGQPGTGGHDGQDVDSGDQGEQISSGKGSPRVPTRRPWFKESALAAQGRNRAAGCVAHRGRRVRTAASAALL